MSAIKRLCSLHIDDHQPELAGAAIDLCWVKAYGSYMVQNDARIDVAEVEYDLDLAVSTGPV